MKRAYFLATAALVAQATWGALPALADDTPTAAPSVIDDTMDMFDEGKLLATGGVSNVEGAGGGGLATWALITGYGTRDGLGLDAHTTYISLPAYSLTSWGVAAGLWDRVEVSYARQHFDTGNIGAALGLGHGYAFDQDIYGAKVKVFGDAVYNQDSWVPQIAVGAQYKQNDQGLVTHLVGAKSANGVDYYVAATKVLLEDSLLLDATVRATRANQFGLLGFGGDKDSGYSPEFEGSAAYLFSRKFALGAEYRTKPSNLGIAQEDDSWDVFVAYFLCKNLSLTVAYVDLGNIVIANHQNGLYLSAQAAL
jgi:Protein of unknown function (DUF3034)